MRWTVRIKKSVAKKIPGLPEGVRLSLLVLLQEMELNGAVRGNWQNYGKLSDNRHHCHLKKGKPTYLAVWEEIADEINLIEVIYVGTHEKAPY